MPYVQLTFQEREMIALLRASGRNQAAIARTLKRSPGTISRELQRNHGSDSPGGVGHMKGYIGGEAHRQAQARRVAANAAQVKIADNALGDEVRAWLKKYWSPQQIAGRLRMDHCNNPAMHVSPEAIYQWVYAQAREGAPWHCHLRRGRGRRRLRIPQRNTSKTPFPGAVRIDERPAIVNGRGRIGDWESDTVVGSRKSRQVLATHVERKSRYVLIRKLKDGRSRTFTHASIKAFAAVAPEHRQTLTADNGSEFARFMVLQQKLGLSVYFAHPYSAWERGTNENTNGLIRQFFPKGADLASVSHQQVAKVQNLLNNRPRKCLNYQTPAEVFLPPPVVALRN